jgi:hypothetical protein
MPVGLVLAVAGGVLASVFAWREVRATRTTLLVEQSEDSRRASELMQQATRLNLGVVQVLGARNGELNQQLIAARATAAGLSREAAGLRGDKVALQFELNQRAKEVAAVRDRLAAAQEVLDADVVPLPVRDAETALDLWTEDGFPTVVQLQALANPPVRGAVEERKQA